MQLPQNVMIIDFVRFVVFYATALGPSGFAVAATSVGREIWETGDLSPRS